MVRIEHGGVIHHGKHVSQKDLLPGGTPLVDHALQRGVVDGHLGRVEAVIQTGDHGILQGGDFGEDHVRVGCVGENDVQQVGQVVGGREPGIAPAADVVGANQHQHQV